ncbi:MAG: MFS transporter, partial [Comamonadaceae bacterium]|nr:MFS transporter [Comamonadaceae bacterium]
AMVGIWLYSLTLPESELKAGQQWSTRGRSSEDRHAPGGAGVPRRLPADGGVSHGPYYTFYSIYLEGHGYSKTVIGLLRAAGRWRPRSACS